MEKRCFRCLQTKDVSDFYRHSEMKDGHLNKCIDCTKADARANRLMNIHCIRSYDRQRSTLPHRVLLRRQVGAEWSTNHPDRKRAQTAVARAIKSGHLQRWPVCAVPECDLLPEAHHFDYSQPLAVVWLCRAHHMQAHAISDEREAA